VSLAGLISRGARPERSTRPGLDSAERLGLGGGMAPVGRYWGCFREVVCIPNESAGDA
jgi:hypothetical protein